MGRSFHAERRLLATRIIPANATRSRQENIIVISSQTLYIPGAHDGCMNASMLPHLTRTARLRQLRSGSCPVGVAHYMRFQEARTPIACAPTATGHVTSDNLSKLRQSLHAHTALEHGHGTARAPRGCLAVPVLACVLHSKVRCERDGITHVQRATEEKVSASFYTINTLTLRVVLNCAFIACLRRTTAPLSESATQPRLTLSPIPIVPIAPVSCTLTVAMGKELKLIFDAGNRQPLSVPLPDDTEEVWVSTANTVTKLLEDDISIAFATLGFVDAQRANTIESDAITHMTQLQMNAYNAWKSGSF
eukprot:IDg15330t1